MRWAARGLVVAAALGLAAWAVWPTPPAPPAWVAEYDVEAKPPDAIPPGTVVDRTAPKGWSHLVIKCLPRIRPAERSKVNALTARMAEWMFTAFVADVRPEPGETRNRVRAVALGLGCTVNGKDTVVTPETGEQLGADLGLITRAILSTASERQRQAAVVFRGPTAWLVDTPVWYRSGGKNRLMRFRYALLAGGPGGTLDTVVWQVGPAGELGEPSSVVWLRPDTIDEAELIPDPDEFTLGVPSEAAFAVDGLPPGRPAGDLPAELRPLAGKARFTADEAAALEAGLRKMLTRP